MASLPSGIFSTLKLSSLALTSGERTSMPSLVHSATKAGEEDFRVCCDAQSGRRAAVHHVRLDHDSQRQLLQMRQLRDHVGVCVMKLIIWGE
jgi:hypothetical protein